MIQVRENILLKSISLKGHKIRFNIIINPKKKQLGKNFLKLASINVD